MKAVRLLPLVIIMATTILMQACGILKKSAINGCSERYDKLVRRSGSGVFYGRGFAATEGSDFNSRRLASDAAAKAAHDDLAKQFGPVTNVRIICRNEELHGNTYNAIAVLEARANSPRRTGL